MAWHGMCELTHSMAGEGHGNGVGVAWAWHARCESALKFQVSAVAAALLNLNALCSTMSFFFDDTGVH